MFDVDFDDVLQHAEQAIELINRDMRTMHHIVDVKAKLERKDHAYRNRTYRLQRSTSAEVRKFNGDFIVEFGARMPYASYVNARGLMRIGERADYAKAEIEDLFLETAIAIGER